MKLNLDQWDPVMHDFARERFEADGVTDLLLTIDHFKRADALYDNVAAFQAYGCYEEALLVTYTHGPMLAPADWAWFFDKADTDKLRALGGPLPSENSPFKVFRGCRIGGGREMDLRSILDNGSGDRSVVCKPW